MSTAQDILDTGICLGGSEDTSADASLHVLDTCGLYCPEPVMLLHGKVREVQEGDLISVRASDPASWRDIPKFCKFLDHELVKKEKNGQDYQYLIRKGGAGRNDQD